MNEEDIRFAPVGRPQLQVKTQNCVRCGKPMSAVGALCLACMNFAWQQETLARQSAILRESPQALEIARDKAGTRHAVLLGHAMMSYCGTPVSESRKKRLTFPPDSLPPDTCSICRVLVEKASRGEVG